MRDGSRENGSGARLSRAAVAAAVTAALLGLPALAQIGRHLKTKDFTYPEFYSHTIAPDNPTNRMKTLLRGALGEYYSNNISGITTARLEHYPESGKGTNLIALSPFCLLDSGAHTVNSTGRVDIFANDGAITIRGDTGFFFDMTNQVLYVSNRNRTVVQHGLFKNTGP
jgi:hypothetical protein